MSDKPTALEQFEVYTELSKTYGLGELDPEFIEQMKTDLGSKTAAEIIEGWNEAHKPEEVPQVPEELEGLFTFMTSEHEKGIPVEKMFEKWNAEQISNPAFKAMMQRLKSLEDRGQAERVATRDKLVADIGEVDKTFDSKRFLESLSVVSPVERDIQSLTIYLGAITHYRKTLPEIKTRMSAADPGLLSKRTAIMKARFNKETIEDIVKSL